MFKIVELNKELINLVTRNGKQKKWINKLV